MAKKRSKKRAHHKKTSYTMIFLWCALFVLSITTISFGIAQYGKNIEQADNPGISAEEQKHLNFINTISPYAIELKNEYGILPSITIAQAIVESDWGESSLAKNYNNYFGIKGDDPTNTKVLETKEYVNNEWETIYGRFRVYSDYKESMKDHAKLFVIGTTWNPNQYQHVLSAQNYADAALALQTDGYATDPTYSQKIVEVIKQYNLDKFDN